MKLGFRLSLVLTVSLLLIPSLAFSQTTGTIEGTVTDASGGALPGVTVEATSPNLQGTRTAVTGSDGHYRFASLPPGDYKVTGNLSMKNAPSSTSWTRPASRPVSSRSCRSASI